MSDQDKALLPLSSESFYPMVGGVTTTFNSGNELDFTKMNTSYITLINVTIELPGIDVTNLTYPAKANSPAIDNIEVAWVEDCIFNSIESISFRGTGVSGQDSIWRCDDIILSAEFDEHNPCYKYSERAGNHIRLLTFSENKDRFISSFDFKFLMSKERPFLMNKNIDARLTVVPKELHRLLKIRGKTPDDKTIMFNMREYTQLKKYFKFLNDKPVITLNVKCLDDTSLPKYLGEINTTNIMNNRCCLKFGEWNESDADMSGVDRSVKIDCRGKNVAGIIWCIKPVIMSSSYAKIDIGCNTMKSLGVDDIIVSSTISCDPGVVCELHRSSTDNYNYVVSRTNGVHILSMTELALSDVDVECPKINWIDITCTTNNLETRPGLFLWGGSNIEPFQIKYVLCARIITRSLVSIKETSLRFDRY